MKRVVIAGLPRADLIGRWQQLYRSDPPKGISSQLLIDAITYEMQARQYGGLRPAVVRQLDKIARGDISDQAGAPTPPVLDPGARLVRKWNGVNHTVDVVLSLID